MNRRCLLTTAAASAASYKGILGANYRISIGIIRIGNRGGQVWEQALSEKDVQPVAACDVYEPRLEKALSMANGRAKGYRDFRKVLEHQPMYGAIIATPDHWHAIQAIMAWPVGSDV